VKYYFVEFFTPGYFVKICVRIMVESWASYCGKIMYCWFLWQVAIFEHLMCNLWYVVMFEHLMCNLWNVVIFEHLMCNLWYVVICDHLSCKLWYAVIFGHLRCDLWNIVIFKRMWWYKVRVLIRMQWDKVGLICVASRGTTRTHAVW